MPSHAPIEKSVLIRATRARVWRALTDHRAFGAWFGAALEDPIETGRTLSARITAPGHEHRRFAMTVDELAEPARFAFSWHPLDGEAATDGESQPATRVVFELEERGADTLLRLTESGFEALPADRRAETRRASEGGWQAQLENVRRHVEG